jgi:hypothetical protein
MEELPALVDIPIKLMFGFNEESMMAIISS